MNLSGLGLALCLTTRSWNWIYLTFQSQSICYCISFTPSDIIFVNSLPSFLNFIFNWRVIALQYCDGFCHPSTWISHRYTYVPSLLNLPPTFHPIPPLWVVTEHQIWAPCIIQQIPTGYLILHMIMCMFQCYSHKSSHPHLPSLSPKVCPSCLHLLCCPVNRFISAIFLGSV